MSEPGFPPFAPRAARPKGQAAPAESPTSGYANDPVDHTLLPPRIAEIATHTVLSETSIEHITICAKCGSREVREAVLIGGEVYVKVEQ